MGSQPISRLLTLAVMVAVSGCALAASSSIHAEPAAVISQASGQFQITNSRDGQALFQAQGLAPGGSVSGTVQLSNTGSLDGALDLEQLEVQDQPGVNGGRLSNAVRLEVEDVTGGSLVPMFGGQLASLQNRSLGSLSPGEARTYRFTASLPDSGPPAGPTSGDNAYAGSALTVRYSWEASAPDPSGSGGGGTGGGDNPGGGGGTSPSGGGGPDTKPIFTAHPTTSFRVKSNRLVRRGWLDVLVSCNRACGVTASAKAAKVSRAHRAVKFGTRRASLTLPGRTARIRLKLSSHNLRQLRAALRIRRRVAVLVELGIVPAGFTKTLHYARTVSVRR
jgi:spore coat-associated protein N